MQRNKRIVLKLVIGGALFLGLLPILLSLQDNKIFQITIFIVSLACYGILELLAASDKKSREKYSLLANNLFVAILFLALAFLVGQWFGEGWTADLKVGFLMLSATWYSLTLVHLFWGFMRRA